MASHLAMSDKMSGEAQLLTLVELVQTSVSKIIEEHKKANVPIPDLDSASPVVGGFGGVGSASPSLRQAIRTVQGACAQLTAGVSNLGLLLCTKGLAFTKPAPNSLRHLPGKMQLQSLPALYLQPLNNSFTPKQISLVGGQRVTIGRQTNQKTAPSEHNGYFNSKVLSRKHAEVWEDGGRVYIRDTTSINGTFINGDRLSEEGIASEPHELKTSDIVEIGIDVVGGDNTTVIHHKVAARVVCVFISEDATNAPHHSQEQHTTFSTLSRHVCNGRSLRGRADSQARSAL